MRMCLLKVCFRQQEHGNVSVNDFKLKLHGSVASDSLHTAEHFYQQLFCSVGFYHVNVNTIKAK